MISKIYTETGRGAAIFEIKVKEIRPKPKSNIRLQTEAAGEPISSTTSTGTGKIKNSNSQIGNFNFCETNSREEAGRCGYHRPSFIEEFIIRIREEREVVNVNTSGKYLKDGRDEVRQKILKYRPSFKETI